MRPAGIAGDSRRTLTPSRSWNASIFLAFPQSYPTKGHSPSCLGHSSGKQVPASPGSGLMVWGLAPELNLERRSVLQQNSLQPQAGLWTGDPSAFLGTSLR